MQVKTTVKAGVVPGGENHNEAQVRAAGLKVRTSVRAGGVKFNHNEAQVRAQR